MPPLRGIIASAAAAVSSVAVLAVFVIFKKLKVRFSLPITLGALVGYGLCGVMLNAHGSTIPLAYCAVFIPIAFLFNLVRRYALETIEKRRITAAFKKYAAPQVVDEMFKRADIPSSWAERTAI